MQAQHKPGEEPRVARDDRVDHLCSNGVTKNDFKRPRMGTIAIRNCPHSMMGHRKCPQNFLAEYDIFSFRFRYYSDTYEGNHDGKFDVTTKHLQGNEECYFLLNSVVYGFQSIFKKDGRN